MSQPDPDEPGPEGSATGRPGRYQRSTGGLVGALVVTLVAITAFVVFRAINRDEVEVTPEPVDYLAAVGALQDAGRRPVYPPTLPARWVATSVDMPPGQDLEWGLGILTDEGAFVGLRQSADSVEDLVAEYVDPNARAGDGVALDSPLATEWRTFTDEGGDTAYAAEVAGQTVLVFGSASEEALRGLIETLSTEPV